MPTMEVSPELPSPLPRVLTIAEIQRFMRLSRPKVYELVNRAGFPMVRVGTCYRIPTDAFLKWLERATEVKPGDDAA